MKPPRSLGPLAAMAVAVGLLLVGPTAAGADHSVRELVSTGGSGLAPASFEGSSDDGSRVFFQTDEALSPADADGGRVDVYERSGGVTSLISAGGNAARDALFRGASADGTRVFFRTGEALTETDTDGGRTDVYERSGGVTSLVSVGSNGDFSAFFAAASADGTRVFFRTDESFSGADTDASVDIYERSGGVTSLVSAGGNGTLDAVLEGTSKDGTRVFFATDERLTGEDTDARRDVYERSGGVTRLVSGPLNNDFDAFAVGASADGTRVFIQTSEQLVGADIDSTVDVYERSAGSTTLVSGGGDTAALRSFFAGASADGSRVFFISEQRISGADVDDAFDVYERSGGVTSLLSVGGNGNRSAIFTGASADGSRVFFDTEEPLTGQDADTSLDIYERSGGATSLVSAGGNGAFSADFDGVSADGLRVFFSTTEPLVSADADGGRKDVYERAGGVTSLVSAGGTGAFDATFTGASADGRSVFFETGERLTSDDTDANEDVYAARVPPPPAPAPPGGGSGSAGTPTGGTGGPVAAGGGPPVGRPGTGPIGPVRDTVAPTLSGVAVSNRRFVIRRRGRSRTPVGTAFRAGLSEAATVRIGITRSSSGRRVGDSCVRPSRSNRRRPRCSLVTSLGSLARSLGAGRASVAFDGRVGGRALAPGSYRATIVATDAAGNRSRAVSVTFTLVAR